MSRFWDIDAILRRWKYRPDMVRARLVRARDGRQVLQMRIDLGLLQMELVGRPDGRRPHGHESYLEYLMERAAQSTGRFVLSQRQCQEVDREFLQYHHRRLCWLALGEFRRAIADADHALALLDFASEHAPDAQWQALHEQSRPLVLFHRAQAATLYALEHKGPEAAAEEADRGLAQLQTAIALLGKQPGPEERLMLEQMERLRAWVRQNCQEEWLLQQRLAEAIAAEQYELAAKIRDQLRALHHSPPQ
ncbi:MAG: UvrB/UvrC motif-containing protein [Thermoguttaceae bacterium]|nr:UvrB/UvrC motif-containing protein [Thermoguttaceae bacterium]MDW8037951.1 UvrB/UvrC motif-containing protein [Thermoguttaceae bacterium]